MKATIVFACGASVEADSADSAREGQRILVRSIPTQDHKTPLKPCGEKPVNCHLCTVAGSGRKYGPVTWGDGEEGIAITCTVKEIRPEAGKASAA